MFKVPTRCPGSIEFDLGTAKKPDVRVVDAYDAYYLHEAIGEELIAKSVEDGKRRTEADLLRTWAAKLFDMKPEEWCPPSAGFVWEKVQETIGLLKKKEPVLVGPRKRSSTARTASQKEAPKDSENGGLDTPSN